MKTVSTTTVRAKIGKYVEHVRMTGKPVAIGRHGTPEALLIRYPRYNPELSEVANFNANFGVYSFLVDEPDLYTDADIKKRYA